MSAWLAAFGAAVAAAVLMLVGCGVGEAGDEGNISALADTYLRALADGNYATACAQLTPAAAGELRDCEAELEQVAANLGDRLDAAADRGVQIEVAGEEASATIRHLHARLDLARVDGTWRIDDGYRLR